MKMLDMTPAVFSHADTEPTADMKTFKKYHYAG